MKLSQRNKGKKKEVDDRWDSQPNEKEVITSRNNAELMPLDENNRNKWNLAKVKCADIEKLQNTDAAEKD